MNNLLVVYDDTNEKSEVIQDVIGNKGFADVVVKKKKLADYYKENLQTKFGQMKWQIVHSVYEFNDLYRDMKKTEMREYKVLHCYSNYIISNVSKALLSFEKINYIDEPYQMLSDDKTAALVFPNIDSYITYIQHVCQCQNTLIAAEDVKESFPVDGFVDIGGVSNFIQCITGNFDSRYFNSLQGDEYTLVKSSPNKKKIKSEYTYYHLLPDDMKYWFVMPFHYEEKEDKASYTMERLHMTDLAVKWVHGSIDEKEFRMILDKYFYFFNSRHSKKISKDEYEKTANALYVEKVRARIEDLKCMKEYKKIEQLICMGTDAHSIDTLYEQYIQLKNKIEKKRKLTYESVIGHGDPCFANTLYSKSTQTLKFIDPKGALTEEELWTNPYYDLAKLSHSVCGRYDFFNNALFDIKIDESFQCELHIDFDNEMYIQIFKEKLAEYGYDYWLVRIYEVSLFLSMLPLHMDYPHKVLGFILNAQNILKEIESYV